MARYLLQDVKLIPVGLMADGQIDRRKNPDGTRKFLKGTLINTASFWDKPKTFVAFEPMHIAAISKYIGINNGGEAQQDQPLPDNIKYVSGCWVDWVAPVSFYKRHLSDHAAQPATATSAARPAIKAGTFVTASDGRTPIMYKSLRLFCQYFIDDETGEKTWIPGSSPEELGMQALRAYCVPIEEAHISAEIEEEEEIVNEQFTKAPNGAGPTGF